MNLDGENVSKIDPQKLEGFPKHVPNTPEQWLDVAVLALEVVGLRSIVRLGDPRLWRQAVAELTNQPLPALNLPLTIWEAYQASPFSGVTLELSDGRRVDVRDWSYLYYSWHNQNMLVDNGMQFEWVSARNVVSVMPNTLSTKHAAILERLQNLERSEQFVPFVVRLLNGRAFLVDDKSSIQIHDSGLLIALSLPQKGILFVKLSEIASITLIREEAS